MEQIYMKARAKINLCLNVINKREDNYHNIKSIFQKINLYDEIYIRKIATNELKLITNVNELNNDENIICKAYNKLKEKYKIAGVEVKLNKKIPMQAGLAGGSTDCAAFILCINKLFCLNLSKKEIEKLSISLGADVVPCLYNKALLVEGIGDIIKEIETNFKYYILIIKPNISNNTKEMYSKLDEKKEIKQIDNSNKILKALKENNIELFRNNLYNVFEEAIENKDIIENIKNEFIKNGAISTLMTGSGSCVYGIYKNKDTAKKAYENLRKKYKTYICTSYNSKRDNI